MGGCRTESNEMVWNGESEPPVVPTSWALLRVSLDRAPVWPCGGGGGFTEESVRRRPPCYLPLEQFAHKYFLRKKPPDIDLEYKCNTNVVLCTTVCPSKTK